MFLAVSLGVHAATGEPKRVLILDSFGRDFAPWNAITPALKTELAQQSPGPIEFHEASLETARFGDALAERPFAEYLRALFNGRKLDLAVLVGGPAVQFWWRHRDALFSGTPVVIGGIYQRVLRTVTLTPNDTAVASQLDMQAIIEIILRVLPQTTNIAVVSGDSPLERFWMAQCRQAWEPFTNRVHFTWLNELPFAEMCRRAAELPPRSAVGYGGLLVDAAGVPHEQMHALDRLCAAANAPVFGLYEEQLGHGIIGGRLLSGEGLGRATGRVAARVLRGESPGSIRTPVIGPGPPMFDWRQLQRWHLDERRLPPGSVVRFRQPSVWERSRWYLLGALALLAAQSITIAALLVHRARRRRAEESAREVSGRLITAQEEERRRIARDLHDNLNQRLALLSVELDLAGHVPAAGPSGLVPQLEEMGAQVKEMSSEVHKLSYQLHPAKLDQLGLVTAARTFCSEFSAQSGFRIDFTHENVPRELPADLALCLYRVLQEAVGNAVRHSGATEAHADLRMVNRHIRLTVSDTGQGFDLAEARRDGGLGLLSMQERARLVHGAVAVHAKPGRGTRVELTVPVPAQPAATKGDS